MVTWFVRPGEMGDRGQISVGPAAPPEGSDLRSGTRDRSSGKRRSCATEALDWVSGKRSSRRGWSGTEWSRSQGLKERLDKSPGCRVGSLGCPEQGQELDFMILPGPFQLKILYECSDFLRARQQSTRETRRQKNNMIFNTSFPFVRWEKPRTH